MSDIYLSRVELKNFRTFGSFALDIPPTPGLTLLVGTNGVGKSSFFDGLEWCLTGQIRRFKPHLTSATKEKDYLTLREAPENSHRVSVEFNRGAPFVRSANEKPEIKDVITLLKTHEWGQIDDIGTYLAFTHFLGQAAQQRFTSRDRSEQWQSLKGPSGIDRLEEVRSTLRGASTRNAFRKRLEDQRLVADGRNNALEAWRESAARLARLRQAATAVGELSGPSLESRVAELEQRYRSISGHSEFVGGKMVIDRSRRSARRYQRRSRMHHTSKRHCRR